MTKYLKLIEIQANELDDDSSDYITLLKKVQKTYEKMIEETADNS